MSKIIKEFKNEIMLPSAMVWYGELLDGQTLIVRYMVNELEIFLYKESIHKETIKIKVCDANKTIKQKLKFNGFTFQTEKTYDVDYENFKDNNTAEAFQHWWNEEGSLFTPEENEDPEEFMKRICGIAWNNGSYIQNK